TLPAGFAVLGADPTPTYASDGAPGGGTFTIGTPAGVTESLVIVFADSSGGACSSLGSQVTTVETTTTSAIVPDGTLAAGTQSCAFVVGADYPLVEAGPPVNREVRPTLTGASGTSDLTASGFLAFTQ